MAKKSKKEGKEITFKCKVCGQEQPLSEMVIVSRYFPQLVVCRDCEKAMQKKAEES